LFVMSSRPLIGVTTSEVRRAERMSPTPEGEPPQHEMALGMPYVRDPAKYGAAPSPDLGPTEPALDEFELAVARVADDAGLPILGICRGAQALNVVRGGTLHQHLPAITDHSIGHRQSEPGWVETHPVHVAAGSRLSGALGLDDIWVNSFHHQAVDQLGTGLRPVAWAPDGTVEGIEDPGDRFVLGVQWHAETLDRGPVHPRLFEALVAAAAGLRLDLAA
jgi:putative glutamine amidotransferase